MLLPFIETNPWKKNPDDKNPTDKTPADKNPTNKNPQLPNSGKNPAFSFYNIFLNYHNKL